MIEVIAMMAKLLPKEEIVKEIEKGLEEYKTNGDIHKLEMYSLILTLHVALEKDTFSGAMKKIMEAS